MKTVQGPSGAARSSVHPIGPERERDLRRTLDERVALPLWAFRDPSYHELEMRCLFHNDWVFACFAEELANPGDYCAFTVAGEPVVMIRGRDGEIRAMSNSCRHRGTPLVAGAGNASSFSCPYHGWTYSDDGSLVGVPFANRNSFDRSSHWLPRFRVEVWNELVFVSLNPDIEPLSDRFAGLEAHLGSDLFPGYERNRVARSAHATWPVNWKLCFEQGVDTYHVFKVHAKTLASEFPTKDAFFVDGTTKWAINGVGRDATEIYSNGPAGQVSEIQDNGLLQVSMPPSLTLLISESFAYFEVMEPLDAENTIVWRGISIRSSGWKGPTDVDPDGIMEIFPATDPEDEEILKLAQRGAHVRAGASGQLLEGIESSTALFHQYVAEEVLGH